MATDMQFKVEWNSDIYMLSVNGEDQGDFTVKVWACTSVEIFIFDENEKKKWNSEHNQWRVLHNDITDFGGVANFRMSISRVYLNFNNRLSNFAQLHNCIPL